MPETIKSEIDAVLKKDDNSSRKLLALKALLLARPEKIVIKLNKFLQIDREEREKI